jgi:hypothetical protein
MLAAAQVEFRCGGYEIATVTAVYYKLIRLAQSFRAAAVEPSDRLKCCGGIAGTGHCFVD